MRRERPARKESLKKVISKESRRINSGVPARKKSLEALLGEGEPSVPTRGGGEHGFEAEHLEEVAEIVPSHEHRKLKLPILMFRDPGVEHQFYVEGELESEVAKAVGDMGGYETIEGRLWVPQSLGFQLYSAYNDLFQLVLLP